MQECRTCGAHTDWGYHSCFDEVTAQAENGAVTPARIRKLARLYVEEVALRRENAKAAEIWRTVACWAMERLGIDPKKFEKVIKKTS